MKPFRPLLASLLAWMLCFQAVAAVADVHCRHPPSAMGSMPHHADDMHAGHSGAMPMSMASGHDAARGIASLCDCGSGCVCAGSCVAVCVGVATGLATVFVFPDDAPSSPAGPLMLAAAHGTDLYRPPSIS